MAAAVWEGKGCLRFAPGDDCEGLEHRLTDVDLHLRLVERLAKPRRVSFGTALAFGLHFQPNPCPRRDYISAALIGHRPGDDLPTIRYKVLAEQVDHCAFRQHSCLQVGSDNSVSFVVSYIHVHQRRSAFTTGR